MPSFCTNYTSAGIGHFSGATGYSVVDCIVFGGYYSCRTRGCGCNSYYVSCPYCGDTPHAWGGWSRWSNGNASCSYGYSPGGSRIVDCEWRTLYYHSGGCS